MKVRTGCPGVVVNVYMTTEKKQDYENQYQSQAADSEKQKGKKDKKKSQKEENKTEAVETPSW